MASSLLFLRLLPCAALSQLHHSTLGEAEAFGLLQPHGIKIEFPLHTYPWGLMHTHT